MTEQQREKMFHFKEGDSVLTNLGPNYNGPYLIVKIQVKSIKLQKQERSSAKKKF